jgi:hypothetical protein
MRQVLKTAGLSPAGRAAITAGGMDPSHNHLNAGLT